MRKRKVTLSIELPVEVVELLAEFGDQIALALKDAAFNARASVRKEENAQRVNEQELERRRQEHQRKLTKDGRKFYRELRKRLSNLPWYIKRVERQKARKGFVADLAEENGIEFAYIDFAISRFRKSLLRRIKVRRERWVLRYYLDGLTNAEIAKRLRVHSPIVSRLLSENKSAAKEAGCSFVKFARAKLKSATTQLTKKKEKTIKWADIKAACGGS